MNPNEHDDAPRPGLTIWILAAAALVVGFMVGFLIAS